MDNNLDRVRAVMAIFGLSVTQVARAGGASRPYLSRALNGTLTPSAAFYRRLEASLGRLIEQRSGQVFSVPQTEADEAVRQVLASAGLGRRQAA